MSAREVDAGYVEDIITDALARSPEAMLDSDSFARFTAPDINAGYRAEVEEARRILEARFRARAATHD